MPVLAGPGRGVRSHEHLAGRSWQRWATTGRRACCVIRRLLTSYDAGASRRNSNPGHWSGQGPLPCSPVLLLRWYPRSSSDVVTAAASPIDGAVKPRACRFMEPAALQTVTGPAGHTQQEESLILVVSGNVPSSLYGIDPFAQVILRAGRG